MKYHDEKVLEAFRTKPKCEWCGLVLFGWRRAEPHHVFARGMGDAFRMDIPENLIALCWRCHGMAECGDLPRLSVLTMIARRQGVNYDDLVLFLQRLRHARKTACRGDSDVVLDDYRRDLYGFVQDNDVLPEIPGPSPKRRNDGLETNQNGDDDIGECVL
jgi:hypothetical protein